MKEKIAGVPVWVWGAVIGLMVVIFMWIRGRGAVTATPAVGAAAISSEEAGQLNAALNGLSSGSNPLTNGGTSDNMTDTSNTSNDWWINQAVIHLTGNGASPLKVQRALAMYISGGALTADERKLVDAAILKFGLPPQGVGEIPAAAPTTATPTAPAPVARTLVKYIQAAGRGVIYAYYSDGSRQGLTAAQWAALGGGARNKVHVLPAASKEFYGQEIPAGK